MLTLAHELGHGYHNLNLARAPRCNASTPMTLAETASIFCETIVRHAAMRHAGPQEQIAILEGSLHERLPGRGRHHQPLPVRKPCLRGPPPARAFDRRACTMMEQTQRETYGDGLDQAVLHPYMWAAKGHYYSTGSSFYNFPYMFGLLFGLASTRATSTTQPRFRSATTTCWPQPAWPTPPRWPRACRSTRARRRSGAPASTSFAPISIASRRWLVGSRKTAQC